MRDEEWNDNEKKTAEKREERRERERGIIKWEKGKRKYVE